MRNDAAQRIADGFHLQFDSVWSKVRTKASAPAERQMTRAVPSGEKFVLMALFQGKIGKEKLEVKLCKIPGSRASASISPHSS